jgi:hypothetical protein
MDRLCNELERRNVFRVAGVCLVVGYPPQCRPLRGDDFECE